MHGALLSIAVVRAVDAVEMPWRNGGGTTREYVREPAEGDLGWRLSAATIDRDGPFSTFADCDRILVLLGGGGVDLSIGGVVHRVRVSGDMVRFAGEAAVDATVVAGPSTDLNLMWHRERWSADGRVVDLGDEPGSVGAPGAVTVLHLCDGAARVGGDALGPGDVAVVRDASVAVAGSGTAIVFVLRPHG